MFKSQQREDRIMRTKSIVVLLMAIIGGMALAFLLTGQPSNAAECRLIRVFGDLGQGEPNVRLDPQNIAVDKGSCVIWVNWGKVDMRINFREGERCTKVTEAATGFSLADGCYATGWLARGTTASLVFLEPGTYEYQVEWQSGKVQEMGRVIVMREE